MPRADRLLRCKQCGVEFLVTGNELGKQIADKLATNHELVCPGCRVLDELTAKRQGYIKWYDPQKRYGFIHQADGTEIFLHASSFGNNRIKHHSAGQTVSYRIEQTPRGALATEVENVE
jgi:cold shock protein